MRTVKTTAKHLVGAIGRLPGVSHWVQHPRVRDALEKKPAARVLVNALYGVGWERIHPFDRLHGTDTSGVVPADALPEDSGARAHAVCYAGSQPNVLRLALAALPPLNGFSFLDLGCGKGRALIVASEFPFKSIRGVELSPPLSEIARRNAAIVAQRHPQRPPLTVSTADASTFPLPAGNVVLFMYHPFSAELVARVVANVEAAIASEHRSIYIVYYNPVAGHCFDTSPLLRRRFAAMLPYGAEERGFGPDLDDPLVIWQGGAAPRAAFASANAAIISPPGCNRALLEPVASAS
jgi:SAM-dependent methyltransferase